VDLKDPWAYLWRSRKTRERSQDKRCCRPKG